jgi:hypothetical protein
LLARVASSEPPSFATIGAKIADPFRLLVLQRAGAIALAVLIAVISSFLFRYPCIEILTKLFSGLQYRRWYFLICGRPVYFFCLPGMVIKIWFSISINSESKLRREIYGGIALGVGFAAIISMFALSNVSKVSSCRDFWKLIGNRLALAAIFHLDSGSDVSVATCDYNLRYTSSDHGGRTSKRVNKLFALNP